MGRALYFPARIFKPVLALTALSVITACARVDNVSPPTAAAAAEHSMVALSPTTANAGAPSTPGAVPAPSGLRACFAGESNALDVINNNLGVISGLTSYTGGKFGSAFNFLAFLDGVDIPNSPSLNFGASGTGITMAAWIFPRGTMFQPGTGIVGAGPIVEYNVGAHMWHHDQQADPEALFANLAEDASTWHIMKAGATVPLNGWHHVAVTYSKLTGHMTLYVDGIARKDSLMGVFTPNTTTPLHIGRRTIFVVGDDNYTFNGAIDEVQLYDRGLSAAEIGSLFSATGTMCVPPPVSYEVVQMPVSSGESGVPFTTQPRVAILDANNNIVSNANTPVTVSVVSGTGTLLGTTTVNAVNGIATFTNLALAGAGNTVIGFTAGTLPLEPLTQGNSPALATVQVARSLALTTAPGGVLSGLALSPQPVVEVRDAAGLRVNGATNVVTASIGSGPGILSGGLTATASNGTAAFSGLIVTGAGTSALTFSSPGLTSASSSPILITGLGATQLAVTTQPANAESGGVFGTQPVIEVRDATGARAVLATGTVTASLVSGSGLGGTVTVPIVAGVATFTNLKINTFGTFTLRFSATGLTAANANPLTVVQKVRILAVINSPSVITSGVAMTPPWMVELRDSANVKVANSNFLVRFNMSADAATMSGTTEKRAVNGVVTFDNVIVTGSGGVTFAFWVIEEGYTPMPAVFTSSVTILANNVDQGATRISVKTDPSGAESGKPFNTQPVIELKKADGSRATTATGNVTASLVSGTGALVGTTSVAVSNGLATFTNLQINGVGAYTLRFSYGTLTPVTENISTYQKVRQLAIIAGPTVATSNAVMAPAWKVEVRDAAGIKIATSNVEIDVKTITSGVTLTGTREVDASSGVATFANLIAKGSAGSFQLKFETDMANSSDVSVTSASVNLLASQAANFIWTGFFDPIDNLPKTNSVNDGETIPIKFSLGGNKGLEIFAEGYPASQKASCSNWSPTGSLQEIMVQGSWGNDNDDDDDWEYDHDYHHCDDKSHHRDHRKGKKSSHKRDSEKSQRGNSSSDDAIVSALKYENGKYQINWKTDRDWDNDCRILVVKLSDGSIHSANFKFR